MLRKWAINAVTLCIAHYAFGLATAQPLSNTAEPANLQSPLELQALQSREFDVNKTRALTAVITVLQDQGYVLGQTDLDTGVVVGNRPLERIRVTSRELGEKAPLSGIPNTGDGLSLYCTVDRKISVTVSIIDRAEDRSRVRISFIVDDKPDCGAFFRFAVKNNGAYIDADPARYQEFFGRMQKALFIQANTQ